MTPAIRAAGRAGVTHHVHRYEHDPQAESYGLEAAQALGQLPERVFKTLLAALAGDELVVAVVPVTHDLDLKALAASCGAKKAVMAKPAQAERATGYVTGGISPLGQKRQLRTLIDDSAQGFETVYISAGRRGLEIELSPRDLIQLTEGSWARLRRA